MPHNLQRKTSTDDSQSVKKENSGTYLQYDTSYQGIDTGRKNLRRTLKAPEDYAAFTEYREKIEHNVSRCFNKKKTMFQI